MTKGTLMDAYKQTTYQISGHGLRNVEVLKQAFQNVEGGIESDLYGEGEVIEAFQEKMAAFLGKESAVFFPSGTMAQQIALRIWCDREGIMKVAYHPLSHLEIHEEDGLKQLHQIETILLAERDRVIELEDIQDMEEKVSSILIELPQREIGGQLPSYETLEKISAHCRKEGISLHLDGARLLEVLPYYKKTAAEVSSLFDSVYMSFYKGIGGIAGAILVGSNDFINESKVWKRRYGGDLISLYPYIISADYYFDKRVNNMATYYEQALELSHLFNACRGISTKPTVPVSNMFHVHFEAPKEKVEEILKELYHQTGIGLTGNLREFTKEEAYYEVSIGDIYEKVPRDQLRELFRLLDLKLAAAIQ
ncbi:threonine aldolase family protein [Bacillus sp. AK128]